MTKSNDTIIGTVSRQRNEEIRVSIRRSQGKKVLDIRIWVQDDLGKMIPTGRGVSLSRHDWTKLRQVLEKLVRERVGQADASPST
jgi:hypothetical protein